MDPRGVMITELPEISLSDITNEDQIAIVDVSDKSVTKSANIKDLKKVFGEGKVNFQIDNTLKIDKTTTPETLKVNTEVIATKNNLSNKVDKVEGKGLSTNDFTNDYVNKLNDAVTKSGDQIITGQKTFTKSVKILNENSVNSSEVLLSSSSDNEYKGFTEIPSDAIELDPNIEVINGTEEGINYKLTVNRTKNIIISSGRVNLYVADGVELSVTNSRPSILIDIGATLYLYNNGKILSSELTGSSNTNLLNNGKCYVYGGEYLHSVDVPHWYMIVNNGEYLELNNCHVEFVIDRSASLIHNGFYYPESRIQSKPLVEVNTYSDIPIYNGLNKDIPYYVKDEHYAYMYYLGSSTLRRVECYVEGYNCRNGKLVINGGYYKKGSTVSLVKTTEYYNVEINDGEFIGSIAAIQCSGINHVINGGYYHNNGRSFWISEDNASNLTINGGTFYNSCIFEYSDSNSYDLLNISINKGNIYKYSSILGISKNIKLYDLLDFTKFKVGDVYYEYILPQSDESIKLDNGVEFNNGKLNSSNIGLVSKDVGITSDNGSIVNKIYVDNAIQVDNDTIYKNELNKISINKNRVVLTDEDQTITSNKSFTKSIYLYDQKSNIVNDELNIPTQEEFDSWTEINGDGIHELIEGNYKILTNIIGNIIIPANSGEVNLYISKDASINTLDSDDVNLCTDAIRVEIGNTLKLYNYGNIICNSRAGGAGKSSILFNNGTCYVYGNGNFIEGKSSHWYGVCNHGKYMEINGCSFDYLEDSTSSMIENGYSDPNKMDQYNSHVDGINEQYPELVINNGSFNNLKHATHGTIKNDTSGTLTINNGYFYSNDVKAYDRCIKSCGILLTINNGEFIAEGISTIFVGESDFIVDNCKVIINGGKFSSQSRLMTIAPRKGTTHSGINILINGGIYSGELFIIRYNKNDITNTDEYTKFFDLLSQDIKYETLGSSLVIYSNKIEGINGSILNTSSGLVITGLMNISDANSAVSKKYVDDNVNPISAEGKSIVESLTLLNDSSSEFKTKSTLNNVVKVLQNIYCNKSIIYSTEFNEYEISLSSGLESLSNDADLEDMLLELTKSTDIFKSLVYRGFKFISDDLSELENLSDLNEDSSIGEFVTDINILIKVLNSIKLHSSDYPAFKVSSWPSSINSLDPDEVTYPTIINKLNEVNSYLKEGIK